MSDKAIAIGFRVHVKPDQTETERLAAKSGIALPDFHPDRKSERIAVDVGTVIDIGPDAWKAYGHGPWVAIGDRIVYARHGGYNVGDDVNRIVVINDEDVVTKLEAESV